MTPLQNYLKDHCSCMTHEQITELFKNINVTVKFQDGLVLFSYDINADFTDPVVCNCRGIILYEEDYSIACYPFDKFDNYNAPWADEIDWSTAKVQEKLDGSLIKLWWNKLKHEWTVSTNSMIYAKDAPLEKEMTFQDLFNLAVNKPDYNRMDKEKTYLFELTSPSNRIVIRYEKTELWHIGTRNNSTLKEEETDIGIKKPKEYSGINNVETALSVINELCKGKKKYEGYVIVDRYYHRIKIKSNFFLNVHYLQSLRIGQVDRVIRFILEDDTREIIRYCPEVEHIIKYFDWQISEFYYRIRKYLQKCSYYKAMDRKDYALHIADSPYKSFGFRFYDSADDDVEEFIKNISIEQIAKQIEKYKQD